jgi:hypothetical protein
LGMVGVGKHAVCRRCCRQGGGRGRLWQRQMRLGGTQTYKRPVCFCFSLSGVQQERGGSEDRERRAATPGRTVPEFCAPAQSASRVRRILDFKLQRWRGPGFNYR